jgi:hypothetical protein
LKFVQQVLFLQERLHCGVFGGGFVFGVLLATAGPRRPMFATVLTTRSWHFGRFYDRKWQQYVYVNYLE